EALGTAATNGTGSATQNIFNPVLANTPFTAAPILASMPTKIAIDTESPYLLDTVNYNDMVIFNGGIRYDDYNITTSGFGRGVGRGAFGGPQAVCGLTNYNVGVLLKPLPFGSVSAA